MIGKSPGVASADATARLAGLNDVARLLWPRAAHLQSARTGEAAGPEDLLIVPSLARPRLAVPAGNARAAAHAVLRHGESHSARERAQRLVLAGLLRSGAGRRLFRGQLPLGGADESSLVDALGRIVGQPVTVSFALTPPRANRKPVLHLFDRRGATVAFVKIGVNPVTQALVEREAGALCRLADAQLTTSTIPQVLHFGHWNDLAFLVLSPLPTWRATPAAPDLLDAGMRELAGSAVVKDGTSPVGRYSATLLKRARDLAVRFDERDRSTAAGIEDVLESIDAAADLSAIPQGPWHGDWTPWNCRQHEGKLLLWDWERFDAYVPIGFDALHYRLQQAVVRDGTPHRRAALDCLDGAPATLARWPLDAQQARSVAALYLAEIGLRYLADDQRAAGGFGGEVETWVSPALQSYCATGRGTKE